MGTTEAITTGEGQEAAALLERTRETVNPKLRRTVENLPGSMRRVAMYHFGWEHADGTPAAGNAGKAIRPALVLAAAQALRGPDAKTAEGAVRAAVAVELAHNFTLLHDDVIDKDTKRRGRPTAWTVFGIPDAIITGDAMMALALRLLAEDPHPASAQASARLAACVIELCAGQQADCAFEQRPYVSLDECLTMATAKTGALLGCACALGALYAGAGPDEVDAMDAFGREAGLAFQLIDDLIGIWGDPGHTGKPAGADLIARKKSLPVVAALTSGTAAGEELAALYAGPMAEDDVRKAADAVDRAGGRDWAQAHAADRMGRAVQLLSRAVPDLGAAGGLLALAEFVTRRTR
ncbi:family 2 encapsulin nanocompartment cargo protein polyprenyl transferase [Streptomyces sp. NBC_01443]|uniref:family 2 encapsulin nanocompartment cargo protein polyprenyl transferase n=1 Tax=Streptomyces sp. NBC_01443 TaxID=2903868 RepID=UPI00225152E3|nr:family 2 encapsulin nanocompartment cargo protein polyprenyl transferase [Streptomyces sp. NBC_01443]MCX4627639.1 family 2 encapsulin nanocompartment cargo protein polyprenyl transferase [Streptomyces sp. NBC_01443]